FVILWPRVLMMRQPPAAVPAHMVSAQRIVIHARRNCAFGSSVGGLYPNCNPAGRWEMAQDTGERYPAGFPSGVCSQESEPGAEPSSPPLVAPTSARVMMPMVFCASLVPWAKPI